MATAGAAIASAAVVADVTFQVAAVDMRVDGPEAVTDVRVVLESGREYVPEVEAGLEAEDVPEAEHVLVVERVPAVEDVLVAEAVPVVEHVPVVVVADREAVVTTKASGR
jgi:hypothetical protein